MIVTSASRADDAAEPYNDIKPASRSLARLRLRCVCVCVCVDSC